MRKEREEVKFMTIADRMRQLGFVVLSNDKYQLFVTDIPP